MSHKVSMRPALMREDLDASKIFQSHKHPTLVTVLVDGTKAATPTPQGPSSEHHWRLPSTDPRDEGKYLFRLHTLDIYFWTVDDANLFVRSCRQTLQPHQLEIDVPPPSNPHVSVVSPVVQQLENVAISDPAYRNGRTRDSRTGSQSTQASPAPTGTSSQVPSQSPSQGQRNASPAAFQPLAYNPSAPPPPEVHAHREKTPPPPEVGAASTGPGAPTYDDHIQQRRRQPQDGLPAHPPGHSPAGSYGSGRQSAFASSPPGQTRYSSQAAAAYTPGPPSVVMSANHSYASTPVDPNTHLYGKPPPLDSPTAQIIGNSYTGQKQPLQHLQPQYPDYLASQTQGHPHQQSGGSPSPYGTGDHAIHSQVYRPEGEHGRHGGTSSGAGAGAGAGSGQQGGKWEQKAEKAEKGLNRLLRKVEKKIG